MPRYHATSQGNVQFTAQEEIDWDAQEAASLAAQPMEDWKEAMQKTDSFLPRYAEDILDGMPNKLSVPQILLDRLQSKKDLRGERP